MKPRSLFALMLSALLLFISVSSAQELNFKSLNESVPFDKSIVRGKLDNGLTYFIKKNKKPENRAELRLVVRAGSVNEDDNQKGLAHLCEHMAFNGTKSFPKDSLVNLIENMGMRFGPDLNAYTSFDETVYMLQVPTDEMQKFKNGMQILEEWAHLVKYEDTEIDKERGVVIEEWRLGKGAEDRVWTKQLPVLFHNSKYADRNVIGDTMVLRYASYETVKKFYKDWYRPDLMSVIVVGDVDMAEVEKMIKSQFSTLKPIANARPREEYKIPAHKDILISLETDPELSYPEISLYFKYDSREQGSYEDFRKNRVESLIGGMISQRLKEYTTKPNPPFLFAYSNLGSFIGGIYSSTFYCYPNPASLMNSYETLVKEAFRAKQNGFTQSELDRAKIESIRFIEKAAKEKDKTESKDYAAELVRHITDKESVPGIDNEVILFKKFFDEIHLKEVNEYVQNIIKPENLVILVSAPSTQSTIPNKDEFLAKFKEIAQSKLDAYKDNVSDKPLFSKKINPGKVVKEEKIKEIDMTKWTLSNNINIYLKRTDFKNDEISIRGFSRGGTSLVSDEDYYSAFLAASIENEAGVGDFDNNMLDKKLAGKIAYAQANITELSEDIYAGGSPEDLETIFQLINLRVTEPRKDTSAFLSVIDKYKTEIENGLNNPENLFYDSLLVFSFNNHKRVNPFRTTQNLKYVDLNKAYSIFKQRFADMGDFNFVIIGTFDYDKIKPLIEKYIGSLPNTNSKESWKDVKRYPIQGKNEMSMNVGMEQKSQVEIKVYGEFDNNPQERFNINALIEVLDIRLREVIREEKSGTYGAYAYPVLAKYPRNTYTINIGWGCDPKRVDELTKAAYDILDELKSKPTSQENVNKVKEMQRKERETQLKENRYWMNFIYSSLNNEENILNILDVEKRIDALTAEDIQKTALKYLNSKNILRAVMYPKVVK